MRLLSDLRGVNVARVRGLLHEDGMETKIASHDGGREGTEYWCLASPMNCQEGTELQLSAAKQHRWTQNLHQLLGSTTANGL